MRQWASHIPGVQFLEVCVVEEAVALDFHRTFGFGYNQQFQGEEEKKQIDDDEHPIVLNGWIPSSQYMPVGYGQLGCSGFIIVDADGNFVSKKTASYLQYGQGAFRHVESILTDILIEMAEEAQNSNPGEAPAAGAIERIAPAMSPARRQTPKKQKQGGNESDQCRTTTTSSPTTVLTSVEAPSSVGVEAMDAEHQICTDSFNRALKDPCFDTLHEVFELLRSHFAHEEELIAKYAITPEQAASPFSALASHQKDHFRILSIAANELNRVTTKHNGGGCSTENGVAS